MYDVLVVELPVFTPSIGISRNSALPCPILSSALQQYVLLVVEVVVLGTDPVFTLSISISHIVIMYSLVLSGKR